MTIQKSIGILASFSFLILISCDEQTSRYPAAPTFAYISSEFDVSIPTFSSGDIKKCSVDAATGSLSNCGSTGITFTDYPVEVTMNTSSGQLFAYVTSLGLASDGAVRKCTINPDTGNFITCDIQTAYPLGTKAAGIAFHEPENGNTYAYIVDNPNDRIIKCLVNPDNGDFASCEDSGFVLPNPPVTPGMNALNIEDFHTQKGDAYMYIGAGVTSGNPYVVKCFTNFSGSLSDCTAEVTGNEGDGSGGISFNKMIHGNAYVVQGGINFGYTGNFVSKCNVGNEGVLIDCEQVSPTFTAPIDIVFVQIQAFTYAYVTNFNFLGPNTNTVTQCKLDPILKTLIDCQDSGAGPVFTHPITISFYYPE